jgi:hypothetical protein
MIVPEWDGEYLWVTMGQYAAMGALAQLCRRTIEPDAPDHPLWVEGMREIFGIELATELVELSSAQWPVVILVRVRELYQELYYQRVVMGEE